MSVTSSPPVRYPSGVSTSPRLWTFGDYPFRTPMRLNEYFTDFNTYNSGDWTVTAGSTGTAALADGNGGLLVLTTAATNADIEALQLVKKSFAFTGASQLWFSINVSLSDATASAFMAGLGNDLSGLAPTDGVYFSKAAASTTLNLLITASSVSTTIPVGTMANATAYTLSFRYTGTSSPAIQVFSTIGLTAPQAYSSSYFSGGNQMVASAASGNTYDLTNLPASTTLLTAGVSLKAGAAAVKTATIDYFLASEEIVTRF